MDTLKVKKLVILSNSLIHDLVNRGRKLLNG